MSQGIRDFDSIETPRLIFVVAMVLVSEEEAQNIGRTIDQLKANLRKPSMEFHFAKTDDKTREKFFAAVGKHDFQVVASVCNKSRIQSLKDNHAGLLLASFGATLEHARDRGLLGACTVKYDEAGSNAFQKKLSSDLLAQVNGSGHRQIHQAVRPAKIYGKQSDSACGHGLRRHRPALQQGRNGKSRDLLKQNKAPSRLSA